MSFAQQCLGNQNYEFIGKTHACIKHMIALFLINDCTLEKTYATFKCLQINMNKSQINKSQKIGKCYIKN